MHICTHVHRDICTDGMKSLDLLPATILLSGPKSQDIWAANYSGGCAQEGTLIPPPHTTALPHMLGCYGNLATSLHPLLGTRRVKEPWLAGLGLIGSKGKSLSAIQVCVVSNCEKISYACQLSYGVLRLDSNQSIQTCLVL